MRPPRRQPAPLVLVALAAVLAAACGGGGGGGEESPATTRRPATTAPATTAPATTARPANVAPLTGLAADPAVLGRPALVVKIDNAPKARPQAGLNQADVVVEEKVEDGVTRFFAIFHAGDSDPVGPVRSARTTDILLVTPLNRPLFSYSGTNPTFQRLIDAAPLVDVGVSRAAGDYRRQGGQPAPYNLFSSTPALFRRAPAGSGPPPPLFAYRAAGAPPDGAGAAPARTLHLEYRGRNITTVVDWAWDEAAGVWRRSTDGRPHVDTAGAQVVTRNVVVQFVNYVDTGARDTSGAAVPEAELIGGGEAWVLTAGRVVRGRWAKPSPAAATAYTDGAGRPIGLTPGQTWVELPPPGSGQLG